ncbi:50S ribosomal protein L2 [Algisphaera agarilytica]|uniref:Large ribosomal subunit protein uL2 n=1 Tax=Algisphaera agarilytica TaxID=1385975 RepID=A0A7X0H850_9BACT|nr:50S ribosomal protein L2 [Algisphaera agarilytica]MBB6431029.1 large subunit ribosomal protein L2 [Algisphaera agarilytica]
MAIRNYKPTTPSRRDASVNLYSEVTKTKPEKTLLSKKRKFGGRNNQGKITVQSRGGGNKQRYRRIDFARKKDDIQATVVGIEYDPNRSSNIALLEYADGEKRYIIAPIGLTDGMTVVSSAEKAEPVVGNSMPLGKIPTGLNVHCIELVPGKGAQLCRSAGTYARLTNREGQWATLVFPSGEVRQVSVECRATLGQVGNTDHNKTSLGKAGKSRHLGKRPHTRGMAKNHHEHPMGGGDNKSSGNRPPAQRSGTLAKGGRTRKNGKASNKRIIRRRVSKRYGQLKLK